MKKPLVLIACLFLAGCTDAQWNHALNYGGMGEEAEPEVVVAAPAPSPQAAAAPLPVAPANNDFCKSVATQDASTNDFDPGTQAKVFRQSYQQCLTIYTR